MRRVLPLVIGLATLAGFALFIRQVGTGALHVAATPSWPFLIAALVFWTGVQPLRAWAWSKTIREPVSFRAVYTASAVGSFLDTVLPGRLGEVSKVGVLSVAAGPRWPGVSRTGGSLVCAGFVEAITFLLVGAVSAAFLPIPIWARWTLLVGLIGFTSGLVLATVLHSRIGHRLPRAIDGFLAGASAPWRVLVHAGAIYMLTWVARWAAIYLVLRAFGVHVGLAAALVYLIVTGIANIAPVLPGNAGVYQGAAVGALALIHQVGEKAIAVSLLAPLIGSVGAAAAALVGLALYARRVGELRRAAFLRS